MHLKTSTFVLVLFVFSFALRAAIVLALRDIHTGPCGSRSADDVEFNNLALHVSQGEGYVGDEGSPTSFRAPGWPLFLAGLYRLAGPCVPMVYGVLCLLGALACVLTYLLARELVEEWTARAAGLLAAIYLPHIYFFHPFSFGKPFRFLHNLGHLAVPSGPQTCLFGSADSRRFGSWLGDIDAAVRPLDVADPNAAIRYPLSAIRYSQTILADSG